MRFWVGLCRGTLHTSWVLEAVEWSFMCAGDEFVDEALPILPLLGASTTDVMVLNFAVWSNKY